MLRLWNAGAAYLGGGGCICTAYGAKCPGLSGWGDSSSGLAGWLPSELRGLPGPLLLDPLLLLDLL